MKKLALLALLVLPACGNPLGGHSLAGSSFQPGAPATSGASSDNPTSPDPQPAVGADTGTKISAGSLQATGSQLALKATISADDQPVAGTQLGGSLSINKTIVR